VIKFTLCNTDAQHNVTSLVDKSLTLQCPLAAAKRGSPRITWQKRDNHDGSWRLLPRDSSRVRVRPGRLEFDRVLSSDAGYYRCSKTTARGVDIYSIPIVLIVHGKTLSANLYMYTALHWRYYCYKSGRAKLMWCRDYDLFT